MTLADSLAVLESLGIDPVIALCAVVVIGRLLLDRFAAGVKRNTFHYRYDRLYRYGDEFDQREAFEDWKRHTPWWQRW